MTKTDVFLSLEEYLKETDPHNKNRYIFLYESKEKVFANEDDIWLFLCELDEIILGKRISRILEEEYEDFLKQLSMRYGLKSIDGIENAAYALCHEPLLKQAFPESGHRLSELLSVYALMRAGLPLCKEKPEELHAGLLYPIFLRGYRTLFPTPVQLEHVNIVFPYLGTEEIVLFMIGEAGDDMYEQVQILQEELHVRYPKYTIVPELSGMKYPKTWSETSAALFSGKLQKLLEKA